MVFWGKSKSSLRADAAEAEVAFLREKIQALRGASAPATSFTKSASSVRADAAEAELAKLRERINSKHKSKCLKFTCKIGWCSHNDKSVSAVAEELERLNRRLTAVKLELEQKERFSMIRSEMERNIKHVAKDIQLQYANVNSLDIVIVLDCTASMLRWIDESKTAIVSIINNVKSDHPNAFVRVGFVAYRDFCDGDKRLEIQDLTADVANVQRFISSLEAFGGGDSPEDIPGGLKAALAMSFESEARRIVLVCDAPCHGRRFRHMEDDDTYRRQINRSPNICAQMRKMAKRGIDFTFVEIRPEFTAKMAAVLQEEFKSVVSHDGFDRDFQLVSLSNAGDAALRRFANVIRSTASSSISASKERSAITSSKGVVGTGGHTFGGQNRPTSLVPILEGNDKEESVKSVVAPPEVKLLDWSELDRSPMITAVRHSLHFQQNEYVDWENLALKHTQQETTIRFAKSCFAKGAMRSAHALYDCKMDTYLIAKIYFGKAAARYASSKNSLEDDVKTQIVAKRLATEFSLSECVENAVDFIFTCWYEIRTQSKLV